MPSRFIRSLNFHRRHLSVTQKACIGVGYKRELQGTVRQGNPTGANQYTQRNSGNITTIPLEPSPPSSQSKVRDLAAAKVGVSGKVIDLAEQVAASAPDLFADMQAGEMSVWEAQRTIKKRAVADALRVPRGKLRVADNVLRDFF